MTLKTERDAASANLEFENAAALHAQVQKVEAVRALAGELVRPLSELRAVIVQQSAKADEVAVFLFEQGRLRGPGAFSTVGMRIQNEQSGSSSLFAQPMMIEAVPEDRERGNEGTREQEDRDKGTEGQESRDKGIEGQRDREDEGQGGRKAEGKIARGMLEGRLAEVLERLGSEEEPPSAAERQGHLALLKCWYYRPEARREGEICFPDAEGHWPLRSMLRSVGRVAAKGLTQGRGA